MNPVNIGSVVFGRRSTKAGEMPPRAVVWKGRAPKRHASLDTAAGLTQELGELRIGSADDELSPYHSRFSQGANLVPRLMFRVEGTTAGALGVPRGHLTIRSKRSVSEKKPWKDLPALTGTVESQFVWPTVLGEHILQFRLLDRDTFVLPLTSRGDVMDSDGDAINAYPGLATWMRTAAALWSKHGGSKLSLDGQIDHMRKLSQQLPIPPVRVAYAASGMHLSAALVTDPRAVIEHGAYWGAVASESEGHYLVGILNTPTLTELVRPLMSYGKDERHIDKAVWRLPIPTYDADNALHQNIVATTRELTAELATQEWRSDYFVTIRQDTRAWLLGHEKGRHLDNLVRELLGEPPLEETASAAAETEPTGLLRVTSGSLELPEADVEIDLDLEFDEDHRVYLWGYLVTEGEESRYVPVGTADADPTPDALARDLLLQVSEVVEAARAAGRSVRIYHYGSVEAAHLARLLGSDAEPLLAAATDLLAVLRAHFFSGGGYGLKSVAGFAGFEWRSAGMTGADTYELIGKAREGDEAAWQTLLEYNEDDTRATLALRRWLRSGGGQPNSGG